ncbi:MAG: flagellar hook-basal body protein, partial [Ruminococcaceae bacterium]|nr:flagellar hook-basal body protein [Oscillospiraceae bacterium]
MNISFYTASTGAQQQQDRLDVHANNIANVNTYGFRAKQPSFSQLMTGPIVGI